MSPAGHAHVKVLGAGGPVHDDNGRVGGHALPFVDGDGVAEGDVFLDVGGGEGHGAAAVEG